MKKNLHNYLLATMGFVLLSLIANAQVATNYLFSSSSGTYTPITGGTVVATATDHTTSAATSLDAASFLLPLPFPFNFNGTSYTTCNVNGDGNITFGGTAPTGANASPISGTTAYNGAVAAMGRDLWGCFSSSGTRANGSPTITGVTQFTGIAVGLPIRGTSIPAGTTITAFDVTLGTITMSANSAAAQTNTYIGWPTGEIRAEAIGTAPNRTFVIQYKGMNDWSTTAAAGGDINFQIQLEEGNGIVAQQLIKFVYGPSARTIATSVTQQVGLRGTSNADFNNRLGTTDWTTTTAGTANSSTIARTNTNFPASGLTYTWTPNFCINPPTPGTTTASSTFICSGSAVNFNLSGNTQGNGQTYQYQRSISSSGPFTNVGPSLTNQAYTIPNITHDSFYRCRVTCSGASDFSTPVQVVINTGLSGSYTINSALPTSTTNFQSFTAAANALACGVVGPVIFDVDPASGPYTEQIVINQIPGASATNRIIFNGHGRTIQFAASVSADRQVIRLSGADYVTINDLKIINTGATYAWGIHLTNEANFDSIVNCNIDVSANTSTTQSNSAGIVASGSTTSVTTAGNCANNLVIIGSVINGGYQGIIISGASATARASKNIIINDTIKNFYETGIILTAADSNVIHNNDIHRINRATVTTFAGVEIGANNSRLVVSANKIHDTHNTASSLAGTAYGVYSNSCDAPQDSANLVYNNLIYNFNSGSGTIYALYNSSSDGMHYYHNTVVLDHATATAGVTRGFYQLTAATDIEFKNNNIYINRTGTGIKYCMYLGTTTSAVISDYNNLYIGSTGGTNGVGYFSAGYTDLTAWKTANGGIYDQASKSVTPSFVNAGILDYAPSNPALNDLSPRISPVLVDITNLTRGTNTEPGAFEYIPGPCATPIAGTPVLDKILPQCAGNLFTIDLVGNSINTGQTYQWLSSSTLGGVYTPVSGLLSDPTFNTSTTGTIFYKCEVTCPSTTTSAISSEIEVNTTTSLAAGTYSIDPALPASSTNFQSFATAVNTLNCGTTGSVIFNIANGTYNERFDVSVLLTNKTDSIVFQSANADTSLVHIQWPSSASPSNNSIVSITNSRNIFFKNISFVRTGSNAFSTLISVDSAVGLKFIGNAFVGPTFTAVNTTGTQSHIFSDDTKTEDSTIIVGNNFIGNSNALWFYANLDKKSNSTIIANNTMTNSYYSIALKHHNGGKITNNTIIRNGIPAIDFYGINLENCDSALNVSYNKIVANRGYGIKLLGSNGTTAARNKIYNNMITLSQGTGTSLAQGIRLESNASYNTENVDVYHNTVYVKCGSATAGNVIFLEGTAAALTSNITIKNNILSNVGSGYVYNAVASTIDASTCVFDRNNIYAAGANIGTWNGTIIPKNQKTWISVTHMDSLSSFVPVNFIDTNNLHLTGVSIGDFNLATDITTLSTVDFDGTARTGVYFNKGAHEASALTPPTHTDAAIWSIDSIGTFSVTGSNNLVVTLRNNGFTPLTSVDIMYKLNGTFGTLFNWTGTLAPGKTAKVNVATLSLPIQTNIIEAWTENTNFTSLELNRTNDTVKISTSTNDPLTGTYTVGTGAGFNFANLTAAANAIRTRFVTGNVIFELDQSYSGATEIFPVTFTTRPEINQYTFTVRPAPSVTALVTEATPASGIDMFLLDSTIGFTFDGRPGGVGTTSEWTIRNKQITTTYGANIYLISGAQHNTFKYLKLEGQTSSTTNGLVVLYYTTSQTRACSYNTFDNCTFSSRTDTSSTAPAVLFYSYSTGDYRHAFNTITNSKFINFANNGVYLNAGGNGGNWTFANNHFYNNMATPSAVTQIALNLAGGASSVGGMTITGNYIGGSAPFCGGTPLVNTSATLFTGILLTTDSMETSVISNNTIANIKKTNTGAAGFAGISAQRGKFKITDNIIGRAGTTDSITSTGTSYVIGIEVQNDLGTADSTIITGNTVSYLVNYGTAVASRVKGIAVQFTTNVKPVTRINNNIVHHLSTMGTAVGYNPDLATAIGIYSFLSGYKTGCEYMNNVVYDITAANTGTASTISAGMVLGNGRGRLANNKVYGIANKSTAPTGTTTAVVAGIYVHFADQLQVSNNMISISGDNSSSNAQLNGILVSGNTTGVASIYYNSVNIENTTGTPLNSYAFHRGWNNLVTANNQPILLKNNIFKNTISSAGSHYGIGIEDTTAITAGVSAYNLYQTANAATMGIYGSVNYNLAGWRTRTSNDLNSKTGVVNYLNTAVADLHLTSSSIGDLNFAGTFISSVTKDFDNETRDLAKPYIGADENPAFPLPVTLVQFTATESNKNVVLNWATATENNSSHFEIERSADGKTFEKVNNVKAKGQSGSMENYRIWDEKAFSITASNTLYYRLKMVDIDGKFEYSKTAIVSIRDAKETTPLSVFPNPFTDKTYININATQATDAKISIVDITGKVIVSYTEAVMEGISVLSLQQSETLKTGIYFVSIELNGAKQTAKLVKQ